MHCERCRSLFVDPMPDGEILARMYGRVWDVFRSRRGDGQSPRPRRVREWLSARGPGTFIDYGCGAGELLVAAGEVGWQPIGVEFAPEVAREVEQRSGARCVDETGVAALG
jgi:hypothetical protein